MRQILHVPIHVWGGLRTPRERIVLFLLIMNFFLQHAFTALRTHSSYFYLKKSHSAYFKNPNLPIFWRVETSRADFYNAKKWRNAMKITVWKLVEGKWVKIKVSAYWLKCLNTNKNQSATEIVWYQH